MRGVQKKMIKNIEMGKKVISGVTAAQPIIGGIAPATPPITMLKTLFSFTKMCK